MSDAPTHVSNRAWAGDPAVPPIEYEVLGREYRAREKRLTTWKRVWALIFFSVLGGMALWLAIDLLIWGAGGALPYMQRGLDRAALLVGIATGTGFGAVALLLGRAKLLPLALLPAMGGSALAGGVHYLEAISAKGPMATEAFYVQSLDLHSGRNMFRTRRYQASATLIDHGGRRWTLSGRYQYIQQLAGQDCVTVTLREEGQYRFPTGTLVMIERPYLETRWGKRHPERCFVGPSVVTDGS